MNTRQSKSTRTTNQQRASALYILVTLDTFVLGGLVALWMANRFLNDHVAYYGQRNLWDAGSAILDLRDDLLIYFVAYTGALLLLLLITAIIWVWSKTRSQMLRHGVVVLIVSIVLVAGAVWVNRITTTTSPPPMTPTPIALIDALFHSNSHNGRSA